MTKSSHKIQSLRPWVLSIAGYDPSAGAGLLADIKAFEANQVYGMGVCTALSFQNDNFFKGTRWVALNEIYQQMEVLADRFHFPFVKIGLIENLEILDQVIDFSGEVFPNTSIIWDPIIKTGSGFQIHERLGGDLLFQVLNKTSLITPNWEEMQWLFPENPPFESGWEISQYCPVFLKGGHHNEAKGVDYLFRKGKEKIDFQPRKVSFEKHGSGCVLSSAIAANLAKGSDLAEACEKAKDYTTGFLSSNESLLGYHF